MYSQDYDELYPLAFGYDPNLAPGWAWNYRLPVPMSWAVPIEEIPALTPRKATGLTLARRM